MPSKTVEDFAYQIKDYMRSAEVVEGKNQLDVRQAVTISPSVFSSVSDKGILSVKDISSSGVWGLSFANKSLKAGKTYVISTSAEMKYGRIGLANAYGEYPTSTYYPDITIIKGGSNAGTILDKNTSYTIFTSNIDQTIYLCFGTDAFSSLHQAYQFGIMLCTLDEWNKSHTYEPYYMPVKDRLVVEDITSQLQVNTSLTAYEVVSGYTHCTRYGNLITFMCQLKSLTEDAAPAGRAFQKIFSNLPKPLYNILISTDSSGTGNNKCELYMLHDVVSNMNPRELCSRGGTIGQYYTIYMVYLTED